jgi:hypothetical protein
MNSNPAQSLLKKKDTVSQMSFDGTSVGRQRQATFDPVLSCPAPLSIGFISTSHLDPRSP